MRDEPLFEVQDVPPPVPRYRPPMPPGAIRWTKLGPTHGTPCDDCMALHVESTTAPLARRARWRRLQGGKDRLLCHAHGQVWRQRDGAKPLPE